MKICVNLRLPVILACSLATGAAAGLFFKMYQTELIWLTAFIPAAAIPIIILTAVFKSFKPLVFIILALLFVYAGALSCILRLDAYDKTRLDVVKNRTYTVCGTVKEKSAFSGGEYIVITDATADGARLGADVIAYLAEGYGDFCDNGYKVKFLSSLKVFDTFEDGKLSYNAQSNIKYSCSVKGGLESEYSFSLFGKIRSAVRRTLFEHLEYETAAVCYGMLIGETAFIDGDAMDNFRYGGIAHIFAVSGLHIGIVFALIGFFLKKLKCNKYASAILCIFCVFFYAGVCGFTVSSLRAAIMCAVATLSRLAYTKYDGLNSLAAAVILLLFINPLNLFSVGFQLSVCAVGGIFLFSKPLERILCKIKIPQALLKKLPSTKAKQFLGKLQIHPKIASACTISLSAQAGTLPVMLSAFGYLSGASLVLNIIVVPLLSALFSVLFIVTMLCTAVAPVAAYILPLATAPLDAVLSFLIGAGFEKSLISGFGTGLFAPLYYITVIFLSDKLNLKPLTRFVAFGCSLVLITVYVLAFA